MNPSQRALELRDAYDAQLRGLVEVSSAQKVSEDGPAVRALFSPEYGYVSHRSLEGLTGPELDALIERTIAHFRDTTKVVEFEWKTRGHDRPVDFTERLVAHGFVAQEVETVMIGETDMLAENRVLPEGVAIRRIGYDNGQQTSTYDEILVDVQRMIDMQNATFDQPNHQRAEDFTEKLLQRPEFSEAWIAEADGEVICTGRLEVVPGTQFAGLWSGATRADWRRQGIYRALTAARALSARAKGVLYLQSDCTEYSRPILERSGFTAVTTTTPYIWHRPER